MTKVKICGLMQKSHVIAAVEAGADAVGFVFAPSKRRITIDRAHELAKLVPAELLKIGVFVNPEVEELEQAIREVPLDYIQLHGNEGSELIEAVKFPTIKAIAIREEQDVEKASNFDTEYMLFDAPGTNYMGGSGMTFDWKLLNGHRISPKRVILAGGLNVSNVKEAIERVKPFMVDVSSGVEIDGKKDEQLIREFILTVKDEER
ncbi:phosphoribosylanthranilate isomerase [uncultured Psychrobacillus sp.]|uniref:phosphoribosylanthranilate isomerase n=1 Tax=uncultured Psychrobacillus sp. TaxID=1551585 RepID=UPI00262C8F00|nr:phosphoribosylanthranilate isomerase [uncultured Psychrobacillus sp.]